MKDFLRKLRRLLSWPPDRRWWGSEWLLFLGFLVGSWYWTVEDKLLRGIIAFGASIVLEAVLFHLFIRKGRSHGAQ